MKIFNKFFVILITGLLINASHAVACDEKTTCDKRGDKTCQHDKVKKECHKDQCQQGKKQCSDKNKKSGQTCSRKEAADKKQCGMTKQKPSLAFEKLKTIE